MKFFNYTWEIWSVISCRAQLLWIIDEQIVSCEKIPKFYLVTLKYSAMIVRLGKKHMISVTDTATRTVRCMATVYSPENMYMATVQPRKQMLSNCASQKTDMFDCTVQLIREVYDNCTQCTAPENRCGSGCWDNKVMGSWKCCGSLRSSAPLWPCPSIVALPLCLNNARKLPLSYSYNTVIYSRLILLWM